MNGELDVVAGAGLGVGVSLDVETLAPQQTGFFRFIGRGRFIYSAKYLCGTIQPVLTPTPFPSPEPVNQYLLVPGVYLTSINVHNPHAARVTFTKRAVRVNPQRKPRGVVGTPVVEALEPNEGIGIDCEDINILLGVPTPLQIEFVEGFVVIDSPRPLVVTAVYTLERLSAAGRIVDVG